MFLSNVKEGSNLAFLDQMEGKAQQFNTLSDDDWKNIGTLTIEWKRRFTKKDECAKKPIG